MFVSSAVIISGLLPFVFNWCHALGRDIAYIKMLAFGSSDFCALDLTTKHTKPEKKLVQGQWNIIL